MEITLTAQTKIRCGKHSDEELHAVYSFNQNLLLVAPCPICTGQQPKLDVIRPMRWRREFVHAVTGSPPTLRTYCGLFPPQKEVTFGIEPVNCPHCNTAKA